MDNLHFSPCLFSLEDLLRNFDLAIGPSSAEAPWGSVRLAGLRPGHTGEPRR